MSAEDPFVDVALETAARILQHPLQVRRGASLLYNVAVDNRLRIRVDPSSPKRGSSAFQTDLCVFEIVDGEISIPRVVMEFKTRLTTHDILVYSNKAERHKQIYPYLRYGIVVTGLASLSAKFFKHNVGLDFAVALGAIDGTCVESLFQRLLTDEVAASRCLERLAFEAEPVNFYRRSPITGWEVADPQPSSG